MGSNRSLRRWWVAVVLAALAVSGCGGDDTDEPSAPGDGSAAEESTSAGDGSAAEESTSAGDSGTGSGESAGTVADAPPSGQATASVDGLDLTFDLPGGLACTISNDALTYSYRIGDNEVTLGAGVNRVDGGWMGSIALTVANPVGEQGPIAYYPAPGDLGVLDESLFTIDGDTAMYSGPMLKQPANDGSQPPPIDVGTGTVIATC